MLIFPTANTTWVYDAATQAWHERAGFDNGEFTRHRSNCQMAFNNKIVVGDFENGNIYAFDLDDYSDNGGIQKWLRSWRALPTGQNNLKRTAHHSLQLDCETGVGLNLYPGYDSENIDTESGLDLVAEYVQHSKVAALMAGVTNRPEQSKAHGASQPAIGLRNRCGTKSVPWV